MKAEETQQDKREEFKRFYEESYGKLLKYVGRMDGMKGMAEDIVQEVFCRAYINWDDLRNHENPKGWLYVTATNVARNLQRARDEQMLYIEDVSEAKETPAEADHIGEIELRAVLQAMFSGKDRELIRLHCDEGYSMAEIARQQAHSEESVRMRMSRIRKQIRGI